MNIQYVVNFNKNPAIIFEADLQIQPAAQKKANETTVLLAAFLSIKANGYDVDDVCEISTYREVPSSLSAPKADFEKLFDAKFSFSNKSLHEQLVETVENLDSIDCASYAGITRIADRFAKKLA